MQSGSLRRSAPAATSTSPDASRARRSTRPASPVLTASATIATISSHDSHVHQVRGSAAISPTPVKWPWPSMNPGIASCPCRSMTSRLRPDVALDFGARAERHDPVAAIGHRLRLGLRVVDRDDAAVGEDEIWRRRGLRRAARWRPEREQTGDARACSDAADDAGFGWCMVDDPRGLRRRQRQTCDTSRRGKERSKLPPKMRCRVERGVARRPAPQLRLVDRRCQPRGKNDESVPNSSATGRRRPAPGGRPLRASARGDSDPAVRAGGVEMDVRALVGRHQRLAEEAGAEVRQDHRHLRKADATRATASGSPRRRSKRLGSPSFLRTPTVSTPQCTNTALPCGVRPRRRPSATTRRPAR